MNILEFRKRLQTEPNDGRTWFEWDNSFFFPFGAPRWLYCLDSDEMGQDMFFRDLLLEPRGSGHVTVMYFRDEY